jgi:23S rRNA (cytosine1962-C5)-methyltransferase
LEVKPNADYALIDSGDGEKLEQYGPLRIVRPENQAIWRRALPDRDWKRVDAVFTGDTDEEGMGRWRFPDVPLGETWPMRHDGIDYLGRFTSFRHVGVFPEQASHWDHMAGLISQARRPVRVLNLFGYTGLASLVAARAGAEVTHVDASKKAIGWARENQVVAGLADKPIRWICDDAVKFAEREARRGSTYDIILFDPPAYGRGPKGEVWQLFSDLPFLTDLCRRILTPKPLAVVLTAYSIRASFFAIHALMRDNFAGMGGTVESGELIIREKSAGRALSTSLFSRWIAS